MTQAKTSDGLSLDDSHGAALRAARRETIGPEEMCEGATVHLRTMGGRGAEASAWTRRRLGSTVPQRAVAVELRRPSAGDSQVAAAQDSLEVRRHALADAAEGSVAESWRPALRRPWESCGRPPQLDGPPRAEGLCCPTDVAFRRFASAPRPPCPEWTVRPRHISPGRSFPPERPQRRTVGIVRSSRVDVWLGSSGPILLAVLVVIGGCRRRNVGVARRAEAVAGSSVTREPARSPSCISPTHPRSPASVAEARPRSDHHRQPRAQRGDVSYVVTAPQRTDHDRHAGPGQRPLRPGGGRPRRRSSRGSRPRRTSSSSGSSPSGDESTSRDVLRPGAELSRPMTRAGRWAAAAHPLGTLPQPVRKRVETSGNIVVQVVVVLPPHLGGMGVVPRPCRRACGAGPVEVLTAGRGILAPRIERRGT